jgi:hypothetical protein
MISGPSKKPPVFAYVEVSKGFVRLTWGRMQAMNSSQELENVTDHARHSPLN